MSEQFHWGKLQYVSFIVLDIILLILANIIAVWIYLDLSKLSYTYKDYMSVVIVMAAIDVLITVLFNTLNQVLRRRNSKEMVECLKHVGISFVLLALILFFAKQGSQYSRVTVFLAYGIYYFFLVGSHIAWKWFLKRCRRKELEPTALLVTTVHYLDEGLSVVKTAGMVVKGFFITDKTNAGTMYDIPIVVDRNDALAFLCWEWIDKVYVCGPDNMDVPDALIAACQQMDIPVFTAPSKKSLDYEVVKIRTALVKDGADTGLSFFEGERDIPFRIARVYAVYESEQERQKGYHAHKQSWHLLFCPYGSIDVVVDTGRERKIIALNDPSTGLILHPGVWREMLWKRPGSVLCVAASGHYDVDRLRSDYDEYMRFLQEKEWSATVESAEIIGENVL